MACLGRVCFGGVKQEVLCLGSHDTDVTHNASTLKKAWSLDGGTTTQLYNIVRIKTVRFKKDIWYSCMF